MRTRIGTIHIRAGSSSISAPARWGFSDEDAAAIAETYRAIYEATAVVF